MSAGGGRGYHDGSAEQAYYQQHKHQQQQQQHHDGHGQGRSYNDHANSMNRDGTPKSPGRQMHSQQQQQQQQQQQYNKYVSSQARGSTHNGRGRGQSGVPSGSSGGYPIAPSTGQFRSGHIEVDTLYGMGTPQQGGSSNRGLVVNSMNAPNNSTMQCGCENIDCPFCNLMMSVQMKEGY